MTRKQNSAASWEYIKYRAWRMGRKVMHILKTQGVGEVINRVLRKVTGKESTVFSSYAKWIKRNEAEKNGLREQKALVDTFSRKPLISIIMPVFDTPLNVLQEAIQSVRDQSYPYWQLCIANGSAGNEKIKNFLAERVQMDERISVVHLKENLGIAGNSNAAIDLAKGEYAAFLDHDDRLAPFALFELVKAILSDPQPDVVYSDEDILTADGKKRYQPYFKTALNIELLRSQNYMCHLLAVRKTLGDQVGWLREGVEGAQDFDLVLRVLEHAQWVSHIPHILYHWRAIESSTAYDPKSKNYATKAGIKAVEDHLKRLNITARVEQAKALTNYRIHYHIEKPAKISIIIPSHDHANDLQRCIDSVLKKSSYRNYEILIIENNSREEETFRLYEVLKNEEKVRILEWHEPFNYSRINNYAIDHAEGELLLLLNNDTEVINHDWLECMLQYAQQAETGAVGAKLYYADHKLQHAGIVLQPLEGVGGHAHKGIPGEHNGYHNRLVLPQHISAVTAACLMVRKEVYLEAGGFDEKYELAFGDVDFCLKLRQAGFLNVWTPYAELFHHESRTRGYEDTPEKQLRFSREVIYFREKWKEFMQDCDPYYNPNFMQQEAFYFNLAQRPSSSHARCLPVILPKV